MEALRQNLYTTRLDQECLKEDTARLLVDLAAVKAEWDEAVDDVEAIILAKGNLEKALADVNAKLVNLRELTGWSRVLSSMPQGERCLFLCGQVANLGLMEVELLSEFKAAGMEVARLQAELEMSHAEVARL
ncbi:hypothetical protein ACLOJK_041338 [Asimina triloba]